MTATVDLCARCQKALTPNNVIRVEGQRVHPRCAIMLLAPTAPKMMAVGGASRVVLTHDDSCPTMESHSIEDCQCEPEATLEVPSAALNGGPEEEEC